MARAMDYGISALGSLAFPGAGALAKGLANMTGAGRTIMTVTKDGQSYNLSDTGKFSLNEDRTFDAQDNTGSDNDSIARQSRPVQQRVINAASTTEDKPLTGMAGLLAKRDKPISREASNKYSRDLLDSLGYGNVNIG